MKKQMSNMKNVGGFTLVELLIVIVIIGILGSLAGGGFSGLSDQARGTAKMQLSAEGTKLANMIFTALGSGKSTPSNPMVHASSSLEDVIFTGLGVSATYQTRYDALGISNLRDSVIVATEPVNDSSKGVYEMEGDTVVSVVTPPSNKEMHWRFTNSTEAEVSYLVAQYDSGTAFNSATPDTSGRIRYTAGSSGVHTLTIVNQL